MEKVLSFQNSYGEKIIYDYFVDNIDKDSIAKEAEENASDEASEYAFKDSSSVRKFIRENLEEAFYNEINNFDINKNSLEQFKLSDVYNKLKNNIIDELFDGVLDSFLEEVEWQVL